MLIEKLYMYLRERGADQTSIEGQNGYKSSNNKKTIFAENSQKPIIAYPFEIR